MKQALKYDVAIIGGGLAGLCLARQLQLSQQRLSIVIIERCTYPVREAAHKVGESTVEIGAHYLGKRLQLTDYLQQHHLPKMGLRFFFSQGNNEDITQRMESGASQLPPLPSYQIDRGRFENDLHDMVMAAGADFLSATTVQTVDFLTPHHHISVHNASGDHVVESRWVIDASGRAGLLKKQLKLDKQCDHKINASWFRMEGKINVADWKKTHNNTTWQTPLPSQLRYLSTNHLMGEGYWVWLIPLSSDTTSIGIVADDSLHPHQQLYSFKTALKWLEQHEPQLAAVVNTQQEERLDFHTLKHYSHNVEQVFSKERWAITGEAGAFIDPFYSPGTDFIAISNDFIADLILRDHQGENITRRVFKHNFVYLAMVESFFTVYLQQYPLMGNTPVMLTKIVWDYAAYWGVTAMLYFTNCFCDVSFMAKAMPRLIFFGELNQKVQTLFRAWAAEVTNDVSPQLFDPIAEPILHKLLTGLQNASQQANQQSTLDILEENIEQLRDFASDICLQVEQVTGIAMSDLLLDVEPSQHSNALRDIWNESATLI